MKGHDTALPLSGARHGESGHPAPERGHVSLGALWFGIFGGAAAWSVQTLVNFPLAAHACFPGSVPLAQPAIGGLWWLLLAVCLATLAVEVAAGWTAVHSWRQTRAETGGGHHRALETGEGRTRFMAMSGILTSVMFLLASLVHTAALFLVPPCGT